MTRRFVDPAKAKIVNNEVQRTAPAIDQVPFAEKGTDAMLTKARSIMARELLRLENSSERGGLSKDDSQVLISYCKELREWKKEEKEELNALTEEELEALSRGTQ